MSFRRKLLLVFALTVSVSVAAIAWIVSDVTGRAFERANEERSTALVSQFQREFNRRGEDLLHRVEAIAASDSVTRMALALSRASADNGSYFNDAKSIAEAQQLDFLEFVDGQGTIISSAQSPEKLAPIIERVQREGLEATEIVHWSATPAEDETVHAIPLKGADNQLLGVLLVANSRRAYVELKQRIRSAALLVGGAGIVLAILLSGWAAGRVVRPVEKLAAAAREVAAGNFSTQVEVSSADEIGQLAE